PDPTLVGSVTDVTTSLPMLPPLSNVVGEVTGDTVVVHFQPVDGARDYRIYELPDESRIHASASQVIIDNATYRCAGDREAVSVPTDGADDPGGSWTRTYVAHDVDGFTRTEPDATLGYVYVTAGDGRTPVYALGDPSAYADNDCGTGTFGASRS